MTHLISICIPSYRYPHLLERCLNSILIQDYKNVQVIVSDDTPDDSVKIVVEKFSAQMRLSYYHNIPSLGAPQNWNQALEKASGEFLLLLHRDDWLANPHSLSHCVEKFHQNPEASIVFGQSTAIDLLVKNNPEKFSPSYFNSFYNNPVTLLLNNVFGPPSNIMMRRKVTERYSETYKWLVDLEFYIRLILKGYKFSYLEEPLVFVGLHDGQITNFVYQNAHILVKENVLFAHQFLPIVKNNLKIYDHIWRLIRNQNIRSEKELLQTGLNRNQIPAFVIKMIKRQSIVSKRILRNGFISKLYMLLNFSLYYLDDKINCNKHLPTKAM